MDVPPSALVVCCTIVNTPAAPVHSAETYTSQTQEAMQTMRRDEAAPCTRARKKKRKKKKKKSYRTRKLSWKRNVSSRCVSTGNGGEDCDVSQTLPPAVRYTAPLSSLLAGHSFSNGEATERKRQTTERGAKRRILPSDCPASLRDPCYIQRRCLAASVCFCFVAWFGKIAVRFCDP